MKKFLLCLALLMFMCTFKANDVFATTVSNEKTTLIRMTFDNGAAAWVSLLGKVIVDYTPQYYDILNVDTITGTGSITKSELYNFDTILESSSLKNNGTVIASKDSAFKEIVMLYNPTYNVRGYSWYPNKLTNSTKGSAKITMQSYDNGSGYFVRVSPEVSF